MFALSLAVIDAVFALTMCSLELLERLLRRLTVDLRVLLRRAQGLVSHQIAQHECVHFSRPFGPEGVPELVDGEALVAILNPAAYSWKSWYARA